MVLVFVVITVVDVVGVGGTVVADSQWTIMMENPIFQVGCIQK